MVDNVKKPEHYQLLDGIEVIDIIAAMMTVSEFKAYCLGNIMKYRLRAGNKDSLEQDIAKADQYKEIFETKKHLCKIDPCENQDHYEEDKECTVKGKYKLWSQDKEEIERIFEKAYADRIVTILKETIEEYAQKHS